MFRKRDVAIHFVGIGGIGMSGIAEVLLNLGYHVSGSDLRETDVTRRLATLGGRIVIGHRAENVERADVVVVSSAVAAQNPEVAAARGRDIPVIPRAEMLGELMRVKEGIAVAGSHGKTTTTSMLAAIFAAAGFDPTVVIGGKARALGSNARLGHGDVLIAEADESDGSFRHLFPMVALITNIDREHLDHYGDETRLREAFVDFANKVPFYGLVSLCADNAATAALVPALLKRHVTYGVNAPHACDFRGRLVSAGPEGTRMQVQIRGNVAGEVMVRVPGVHHALNALGALSVADFMGIGFDVYAAAIEGFDGVDRRFSQRGEEASVLVVDDYAHHPTEIHATVEAARLFGRRVVVAFQPHRYTRTRDLLADFAPALQHADLVVLTDIYAAGESPIAGVDSAALRATFGAPDKVVVAPRPDLTDTLMSHLVAGDLLLVMGAGDVTTVATEVLARLSQKGASHA